MSVAALAAAVALALGNHPGVADSAASGGPWGIAGVEYRFEPANRRVTATVRGRTFSALEGFAVWPAGAPPESAPLPMRLLEVRRTGAAVTARYVVLLATGQTTISVTCAPGRDGLTLRFRAGRGAFGRLSAGRSDGLGEWRRITYLRNGEAYGQAFWPRAAWSPVHRIWLAAVWDMARSQGSGWDSRDQRFRGEGPFDAAVHVVYAARTDRSLLPLDETLTLRAGATLWQVAPPPAQPASPHRTELARLVFFDVWGGSAAETDALLRHLRVVTGGRARLLTIVQDWQAGGFDSLLPDSIRMPDFPPNPAFGSIEQIRSLSATARSMGRFGLRTNYVFWRSTSPSARAGLARRALEPDGAPRWHTRPGDWRALAARQEAEIQRLFRTNASFTDQITSGAGPWAYLDHDAARPRDATMAGVLAAQRAFAALIRRTHAGPLGSETLMDEQLFGAWFDFGDFGIYDGHHRAFTPEFKLRRIHRLTTYHGMGLMYRFFEMPPFPAFHSGRARYMSDPDQRDDYRASTVLFGNGGYLFHYPDTPWDHILTEVLVVGTLQRYMALQPVRHVLYWHGGRWVSLERLLGEGVNPSPSPWEPQPDALKRIRVEYENGLTVLVNRLAEETTVKAAGVSVRLPRFGWCAWTPDGRVLAYSGIPRGAAARVDYVHDRAAGLRFVNPRGGRALGATQPTLWLNGRMVSRVDPATGNAWVGGRWVPYRPPRPRPHTRLDFRFDRSTLGWHGRSGLGPIAIREGRLRAEIVGEDPILEAPPVDLPPGSVREIVVRMRASHGTMGQLYFRAEGVDASAEEMCVRFAVEPGNTLRDVRIPVGEHPLWRGRRILWLRLDPVHGAYPGVLEIESIRGL
ncbi:MAG TPA: hypothetical protein VLH79_16385 [Chthonomonadales bacterium]|nr:hypothetical protein [Chthonomonadales bacterium]